MKMNALAVLIFLICFDALSAQFTHKAQCLKDMGLTEAQLKKEKQSSDTSFRVKCFFRCILEKSNLIAGNKIIPGAFKKIVGPLITSKKLAQVESSCHGQTISPESLKDMCDFAAIIYKCYSAF